MGADRRLKYIYIVPTYLHTELTVHTIQSWTPNICSAGTEYFYLVSPKVSFPHQSYARVLSYAYNVGALDIQYVPILPPFKFMLEFSHTHKHTMLAH